MFLGEGTDKSAELLQYYYEDDSDRNSDVRSVHLQVLQMGSSYSWQTVLYSMYKYLLLASHLLSDEPLFDQSSSTLGRMHS